MAKTLKNYRLSDETIDYLTELQEFSGKTATDIIEGVINYIHQEYSAAKEGSEHDVLMLAQVLGKRVTKARKLVKTAS